MNTPGWAQQVGERMDDADFLKSFHKWATIGWVTVGLALSVLWMSAVPWVVFMSLWANVVGHWSAWQATRAEVQQNEIAEKGVPLPGDEEDGGLTERQCAGFENRGSGDTDRGSNPRPAAR